jgi:hypothetical protein
VRVFDGIVDDLEKVAVVDANGGTVQLLGGSGVLIVVNGNLEMSGRGTQFDGIIIVEGGIWLHGEPRINGAIISLSTTAPNRIQVDAQEGRISGNITVQYDRCQINAAASKFGQLTQGLQIPLVRPTFSWQEVVR